MVNPKPKIATAEEWQKARDELLVAEKEATRTLDAIAARRRRLPMVKFENKYEFETLDGPKSLLDLFEGHPQLVVYQFMDDGPDHYCPGCTWYTNNVPANAPDMLADQGIAYATVSDMPLEQIEKFREKMGWTLPIHSSRDTTFTEDTGAGYGFLLNVFFRDGKKIYRTYSTTGRGTERMVFATGIRDLVPYGRQEEWEDSPEGWPQHPTYNGSPMEFHNWTTGFGSYR